MWSLSNFIFWYRTLSFQNSYKNKSSPVGFTCGENSVLLLIVHAIATARTESKGGNSLPPPPHPGTKGSLFKTLTLKYGNVINLLVVIVNIIYCVGNAVIKTFSPKISKDILSQYIKLLLILFFPCMIYVCTRQHFPCGSNFYLNIQRDERISVANAVTNSVTKVTRHYSHREPNSDACGVFLCVLWKFGCFI